MRVGGVSLMSSSFRFDVATMRVRIVMVISPADPLVEIPGPFTPVKPPVDDSPNPLIVMYPVVFL